MATLVHAGLRSRADAGIGLSPAWREQSWLVALLAASAAVANWVTTGDHLVRTVSNQYWPVAGMDAVLLVAAGAAGYVALRLGSRQTRLANARADGLIAGPVNA